MIAGRNKGNAAAAPPFLIWSTCPDIFCLEITLTCYLLLEQLAGCKTTDPAVVRANRVRLQLTTCTLIYISLLSSYLFPITNTRQHNQDELKTRTQSETLRTNSTSPRRISKTKASMHGSDCPKCGASGQDGKTCGSCGAVRSLSLNLGLSSWESELIRHT